MKYQQVSVDLVNMVMTACSYLALAGAAWILLRLLQACFWLPRHLRKQNDVQQLLQDKVDSYEKYLEECEAKDKLAGVDCNLDGIDEDAGVLDSSGKSDKWQKQRESLAMLKRELNRVREGGNIGDWDYLLEESQVETLISDDGNADGLEGENGPKEKEETSQTTISRGRGEEELDKEEKEKVEPKDVDEKKDK